VGEDKEDEYRRWESLDKVRASQNEEMNVLGMKAVANCTPTVDSDSGIWQLYIFDVRTRAAMQKPSYDLGAGSEMVRSEILRSEILRQETPPQYHSELRPAGS
jgi:hypothetical protein